MAETLIEWTATRLPNGVVLPGYTFNAWEGCQKVGPGCDHCYAEARNIRFTGGINWGPDAPRRRTSKANWAKPIRWNAEAEESGIRRNVFCSSLADVFDNHRSILDETRHDLADLVRATPFLNWLFLTKRIGNAAKYLAMMFPEGVPGNVWLGITVVNQAEADRDIPKLLAVKAEFGISVVFLSMEPLLGPVDLKRVRDDFGLGQTFHALSKKEGIAYCGTGIDWVIVGGESGPHARPMNPQWARDLRDQCLAAGTAFFFKQNGEWVSVSEVAGPGEHFRFPDGRTVRRTGKKLAGRTLDGVTWDQMPGIDHV